jgi:hypothetical protein
MNIFFFLKKRPYPWLKIQAMHSTITLRKLSVNKQFELSCLYNSLNSQHVTWFEVRGGIDQTILHGFK